MQGLFFRERRVMKPPWRPRGGAVVEGRGVEGLLVSCWGWEEVEWEVSVEGRGVVDGTESVDSVAERVAVEGVIVAVGAESAIKGVVVLSAGDGSGKIRLRLLGTLT